MFMHQKLTTQISLLIFAISLALFSSTSFGRCVYDTTAKPSDGYLGCWGQCAGDVHHDGSDGTNQLSCSTLHLTNYCARYCADAQDRTCSAQVGNPINLSTGAKTHTETDFQSQGNGALNIVRHYSSYSNETSNWGKKWVGLGTARVSSTTDTDGIATFTVVDEKGQYTAYQLVAGGGGATFPVKSNVTAQLILENTGDANTPQLWLYVLEDGTHTVFEFNTNEYLATGTYQSKVLWKTFKGGAKRSYFRDAQDRISLITNHLGQNLEYTYYEDGSDRIRTITALGARVFRYAYDSNDNLTRVYYPDDTPNDENDNPFKEYHYEDALFPNHLTGITDERGNRYATYTYKDNGKANSTSHAGGADYMEVIGAYSNAVTVRNGAGKDTIYNFINSGVEGTSVRRLVSVVGEPTNNCLGSETSIAYDSNGFKDYEVDGRGFVTDYTFQNGLETARREGLVLVNDTLTPTGETRLIETDWNSYSSPIGLVTLIEETREEGLTTTYTYEEGRVKTITQRDTTTHTEPYSTFGTTRAWTYNYTYHDVDKYQIHTLSVDGPRTDVMDSVVQTFNTAGWLTQTDRRVDGNLTLTSQVTEHDLTGLPKTVVDENGVTTSLTYKPRGWLETRTVATSQGNALTTYDYYDNGLIKSIELPNGVMLNYEHDAAQRLEAIYTNDGERIEYELDTFGNKRIARVKNSSGLIRSLQRKEFDDLGRLWKTFGVDNQELLKNGYDENGNLVTITNYNLKAIVQAFDSLNRLKNVQDRELGNTSYSYDARDNLISVTDQNSLETKYVVDGFGRRIQQNSPDTGKTVYHYDLAGNLKKQVDARSVVADFTYDALNRLKTISYPASPSENFTYGFDATDTAGFPNRGIGRLTSITGTNGNNASMVYNELGLLVRDVRAVGSQTYTTTYDYDLAGVLEQITYPSGRQIKYNPDDNGRIASLQTRKTSADSWSDLVTQVAYEPFGPIKSFTYGNGMTQTNSYDLHYQPDTLLAANGAIAVHSLDLGFNLNNEISNLDDLVNPTSSQSFIYDDNQRLDLAAGNYGQFDYEYDGVGNRTDRIASGGSEEFNETYAYPLNSHRLEDVNATGTGGQNKVFGYSDVGNIASDGTYSYEYNHRNRLSSIMQDASMVASFEYNSLGQRIQKTAGGVTTHFHYGQNNLLLAESSGDGTPLKDYVYIGNQLIAMIEVENTVGDPEADLAVSLAHERTGNTVNYTVTVENLGPDESESVSLVNTIPDGVEIDSFSPSAGNCSQTGQQITCELGDLSNGMIRTLDVQITASTDVDISETVDATVSSTTHDPNMENNKVQQGGPGCFIATAAYGSYEHDYLHVLRDFRDNVLMTNTAGQWFVDRYYENSPPIAAWLAEREWAKSITRILLLPLIVFAWLAQASLGVQLSAVAGVFMLVGAWKYYGVGRAIRKSMVGLGLLLSLLGGNASADQIYYVHSDHLNTPSVVTDQNKQVVWQGDRKPFGETTASVNTVNMPIRFPGQYEDSETGLHYNLMRDYHPGLGRYLQSDPIGLSGGLNTYVYVMNNPLRFTDRLGLELDGSWGAAPPFFPSPVEHMNRNEHNICPAKRPDTNTQCSAYKQDEDGGLASIANSGELKWRHPYGYECHYDSSGNLLPDINANYTYNYSNSLGWHIWQDFLPHYIYGFILEFYLGTGPVLTGFDPYGIYTPGLTEIY